MYPTLQNLLEHATLHPTWWVCLRPCKVSVKTWRSLEISQKVTPTCREHTEVDLTSAFTTNWRGDHVTPRRHPQHLLGASTSWINKPGFVSNCILHYSSLFNYAHYLFDPVSYKNSNSIHKLTNFFSFLTLYWSVGITIMLRTKQPRNMGSISGRSNLFLIASRPALGSQSLLSNGYWGKSAKREALHPPPFNAKVKNVLSYTSAPAIRLSSHWLIKHSRDFIFSPRTLYRVAAASCYCQGAKLLHGAKEHTCKTDICHSKKIAIQIPFGFSLFYSARWAATFRRGVLCFLVSGYQRFWKNILLHIHCHPEDGSSRVLPNISPTVLHEVTIPDIITPTLSTEHYGVEAMF